MATDFDSEAEQDLALKQWLIQLINTGDDPPEVSLILDVIHTETMTEWRTALRCTRQQFIQLHDLMGHVIEQEDIEDE